MTGFERVKCFVLVIGNARSGSTLLGSILDGHPQAVVANETRGSANFWRGMDHREILAEIWDNSQRHREGGRVWEGYRYLIDGRSKDASRVRVMGDKVWNPATLLLHGDYALLARLEEAVGMPIKIIHAIRNPFDVIATMHARSRAPVEDRAAWYFMHCEAVRAVRAKWDSARYLDFYHESLLAEPERGILELCDFLGLKVDEPHVEACKEMLFREPRRTRLEVRWDEGVVRRIGERMSEYNFLECYGADVRNLVLV